MPNTPTRLIPRSYLTRPYLSTRLAHLLYLTAGILIGAALAILTT